MISIQAANEIREEIGATHIVIFAIDKDGKQHIATHGKTVKNAKEAAKAGNNLKAKLGWPTILCREQALERICKHCFFYDVDWGMHCFNGWTGDGRSGFCSYEIQKIKTREEGKCHNFEPK